MKLSYTHAFNCVILRVKFTGPVVKTFLWPCTVHVNQKILKVSWIHENLTYENNMATKICWTHIIVAICLAWLIHVVIYLSIVYGLLRYFKQTLCDGGLPDATEPLLPIFHHQPSYMPTAKSKDSLNKNPCDMHIYNSLSI